VGSQQRCCRAESWMGEHSARKKKKSDNTTLNTLLHRTRQLTKLKNSPSRRPCLRPRHRQEAAMKCPHPCHPCPRRSAQSRGEELGHPCLPKLKVHLGQGKGQGPQEPVEGQPQGWLASLASLSVFFFYVFKQHNKWKKKTKKVPWR